MDPYGQVCCTCTKLGIVVAAKTRAATFECVKDRHEVKKIGAETCEGYASVREGKTAQNNHIIAIRNERPKI